MNLENISGFFLKFQNFLVDNKFCNEFHEGSIDYINEGSDDDKVY